MSDDSFRLIVHQGINVGKLEQFKESARKVTAGCEAGEPATLGYEWFIGEDGTECYLNEFYENSGAFLAHFRNIGPALQETLKVSSLIDATVLGDPTPEARAVLAGLGAKFYAPAFGFCRLRW
jgi:hypothetical protein